MLTVWYFAVYQKCDNSEYSNYKLYRCYQLLTDF